VQVSEKELQELIDELISDAKHLEAMEWSEAFGDATDAEEASAQAREWLKDSREALIRGVKEATHASH
jgi:hypothetical protein